MNAMSALRIIPAYAGSTSVYSATVRLSSDHPRIRGEHAENLPPSGAPGGSSPHTRGAREGRAARERGDGSSPHTRGAPRKRYRGFRPGRIIPAYAGSTKVFVPASLVSSDHPRIRGEHVRPQVAEPGFEGSSPHTRGALAASLAVESTEGIIPAYAGSTAAAAWASDPVADHPRIRGEHSCSLGA